MSLIKLTTIITILARLIDWFSLTDDSDDDEGVSYKVIFPLSVSDKRSYRHNFLPGSPLMVKLEEGRLYGEVSVPRIDRLMPEYKVVRVNEIDLSRIAFKITSLTLSGGHYEEDFNYALTHSSEQLTATIIPMGVMRKRVVELLSHKGANIFALRGMTDGEGVDIVTWDLASLD